MSKVYQNNEIHPDIKMAFELLLMHCLSNGIVYPSLDAHFSTNVNGNLYRMRFERVDQDFMDKVYECLPNNENPKKS